MPVPALMTKARNRHLVIAAAHGLQNMGDGKKPGARADVRGRRIDLQCVIKPLMHPARNDEVALAGLFG
ncbi:hypothetical protein D3C87_1814400 [compost metagenome]